MCSVRPFYLVSVFWGAEFRQLFAELCLPSLLAPGNIPSLENSDSRFVIATTPEDWQALATLPIFERLKQVITPLLIPLEAPQNNVDKYASMSLGHLKASTLAHQASAYGVFISPDAMLSDGSIAHIQSLAKAGKTCVLAAALRFSTEDVIAALDKKGLRPPGEPIRISGRELARTVLPVMHPEAQGFEWESPFFAHFPVCCFWRVPAITDDDPGIVLHSQSWAPVLVDYSTVDDHDETTLRNWTIDGDYIYRNFGDDPGIHIIQDSDDFFYVSVTPKSDRPEPKIRNWTKGASIRVLSFGPLMDPLKRRLFKLPVMIHAGDINEMWKITEHRAAGILESALHPPMLVEKLWVEYRLSGWKVLIPHAWRPFLRPIWRFLRHCLSQRADLGLSK